MPHKSLPELQPKKRGNTDSLKGSAAAAAPVFVGNSLAAFVLNSVSAAKSKSDLIKSIAAAARQECPDSFFWYVESSLDSSQRALALTCTEQTALWQTIGEEVIERIAQFETREMVLKVALECNPSLVLLATPVQVGNSATEAILAVAPRNESEISKSESLLALFSLAVQNWIALKNGTSEKAQVETYQKIIQLSNLIGNADSFAEALICCANFVREISNAKQVALAVATDDSDHMKVRAISDVDTFDRSSELCQAIESICNTAVNSEMATTWNATDGAAANAAHLHPAANGRQTDSAEDDHWHRRYSELTGSPAIRALPLGNEKQNKACLLVAHHDQASAQVSENILNVVCPSIANQLNLLEKSKRGALQISRDRLVSTFRKKTARSLSLMALVGVSLMLMPMPYVVKSDCHLEPVHRRFIAAPFDGIVEKAYVQGGDIVVQGQPLAMLDGRQLRIELAGLQANLQSEKKKHDAALANRDISTAQIAMLNVKQLKSEIDWVQRKLENLEICAPIDGVVVAGDLQKSEGAPVQIGQNLFEIGPLDRMLVEIEIPESEIRYVREGQTAKVIFDAFPFEKFIGEIIRVHPQAELRDDNSVFVADVEIDNRNQKLRPGMKGRGRIRSSWQPLGWNLFHGSYESVRAWLVW